VEQTTERQCAETGCDREVMWTLLPPIGPVLYACSKHYEAIDETLRERTEQALAAGNTHI
jgi:hypothetical protein